MRTGQLVRVRPASPVARDWKIPPEMLGTIICSYQIVARDCPHLERLDVRFEPGIMVWGRPADDFEVIADAGPSSKLS
jgi:hypothetical protein